MSMTLKTCLTFPNNKCEEAVAFYVSLFKDGKVLSTIGGGGGPVMGMTFQIAGTEVLAINGPDMGFAGGTSLFVTVDTQEDVDDLWAKLTAGGKEIQCGWLTDKYGLTWQIVPKGMTEMVGDKDRAKAGRAIEAMVKMQKIDIHKIRRAWSGEL